MKLKTALIGLVALGGTTALTPQIASAMPNGLPYADSFAKPAERGPLGL